MPAQSSRSIGFLMLVGSSLTLFGIICNNNAMLSPGFLRYDPSKSNYGLLVTIVVSGVFAFLQTNPLKSRQSPSCLCGTAEAPLGMPEATPTTHQALRGRIETYLFVMVYPHYKRCLLYTSPSPRDKRQSRMPSSA